MKNANVACPASVNEAVAVLAGTAGARVIAGGTDLLIQLDQPGAEPPPLLVSLHNVRELTSSAVADGVLRLGAGVSLSTIAADPAIAEAAPLLAAAASNMASPPVRSRGTIGGNLCNASPAADLAPALYVHEAEVVLQSAGGERRLPVAEFMRGPGQTALEPGELLVEVVVPPLPPGTVTRFAKNQVGECANCSIVNMAVALSAAAGESGERRWSAARIALGAVAPTPIRAPEAETRLVGAVLDDADAVGAAARAAAAAASPIDDIRATGDHRVHLVEVLLPRVVAEIAATLAPGSDKPE